MLVFDPAATDGEIGEFISTPSLPVEYSPAFMDALQREHWSGEPARLGESWRLHKSDCQAAKEAICRLQSHVFGWELILEINGSLYASQAAATANRF